MGNGVARVQLPAPSAPGFWISGEGTSQMALSLGREEEGTGSPAPEGKPTRSQPLGVATAAASLGWEAHGKLRGPQGPGWGAPLKEPRLPTGLARDRATLPAPSAANSDHGTE